MMVPWLECMIGDWSVEVQSTCPKGLLSFGVFYSTSTTVGGTEIILSCQNCQLGSCCSHYDVEPTPGNPVELNALAPPSTASGGVSNVLKELCVIMLMEVM